MDLFTKPFTQQEPISEAAITKAVEVLRSGRLHRYNSAVGEPTETALLEREFAAYLGVKHCLAVASGGYALAIGLRAAGLQAGDKVLCNAFTLSPVPGAIENAGGQTVLVEITQDYKIDTQDLALKAASSGARFLLLSHMRGHISEMDQVAAICKEYGLVMIEDCAHTLGAQWRGQPSGSFGDLACFSTQSYKHMNSGEGGLLVTNQPEINAKAVLLSGSYMLYDSHLDRPDDAVFAALTPTTPNFSGRMDNLRAAILRVQLLELDANCRRWNALYDTLAEALLPQEDLRLPTRPPHEGFVGSSLQFSLPGFSADKIRAFIGGAARRGVDIKWFGDSTPRGFTSRFEHWQYLSPQGGLSQTGKILDGLCDLRLPLTFVPGDCLLIAAVIKAALAEINTP